MAIVTMDGHEITKLVLTPANGSAVTKNLVATNSYGTADEGKVVSNGALKAQTSQNITANGTYDTTDKNSVVVDVQADVLEYTLPDTYDESTGIVALALGNNLLALTGKEYVFAYPTVMPTETSETYDQLFWFVASGTNIRQWRWLQLGKTTMSQAAYAQGSGTFKLKAGTKFTVIGFGDEVSS